MIGEFGCKRHNFLKGGGWRSIADMEWSESLAGSKDALKGVGFPERETHSRWTGQWILNGWGIMDETCGETGTGFSVRMFNPPRKRWDVAFFAAGFQGSWHGGLSGREDGSR